VVSASIGTCTARLPGHWPEGVRKRTPRRRSPAPWGAEFRCHLCDNILRDAGRGDIGAADIERGRYFWRRFREVNTGNTAPHGSARGAVNPS
jgi:hypothetical protein